jgi:hypothetical protein
VSLFAGTRDIRRGIDRINMDNKMIRIIEVYGPASGTDRIRFL